MSLKWVLVAAFLSMPAALLADVPPGGIVKAFDLSAPFGLPGGWRFTAIQAPPVDDHGDRVPGRITLCIRKGAGPCAAALDSGPATDPQPRFAGFHVLDQARILYPRGRHGRPLLLVVGSSLWGFNGDADVVTQLIAYDPRARDFRRIYRYATRRNNNQEVRYIESGPLKGDVVTAEPQTGLPYGYWITVNALTPAYTYRQVARFLSATIYGDGNPLGVIDSEMPNIQRRLGLWRPGMPLPLPPHCAKPHLRRTELWCT